MEFSSCDPDAMRWNHFVRYRFNGYTNQNELIEKIKKFKKDNPQYELFQADSLNHLVSFDSISNLGRLHPESDHYLVSFYLPHCKSVITCFVRPYVKEYGNIDRSIYVLNYSNIPLEVKDSLTKKYLFPNNDLYLIDKWNINDDVRVRLNEFHEILSNFGQYEKYE